MLGVDERCFISLKKKKKYMFFMPVFLVLFLCRTSSANLAEFLCLGEFKAPVCLVFGSDV